MSGAFQLDAFQHDAFQNGLDIASTGILQKPVNCVVEWLIPVKGVETEYDIPPAQRSEKTKVSRSAVRRQGEASTFKVRTDKRGYD